MKYPLLRNAEREEDEGGEEEEEGEGNPAKAAAGERTIEVGTPGAAGEGKPDGPTIAGDPIREDPDGGASIGELENAGDPITDETDEEGNGEVIIEGECSIMGERKAGFFFGINGDGMSFFGVIGERMAGSFFGGTGDLSSGSFLGMMKGSRFLGVIAPLRSRLWGRLIVLVFDNGLISRLCGRLIVP